MPASIDDHAACATGPAPGCATARARVAQPVRAVGPHDLLRLAALPDWRDAPSWVLEALRQTPFVVVRRAAAPPGMIAAGVRGPTRAHRYAGLLGHAAIDIVLTPEQLADVPSAPARARAIGALAALPLVREFLASLALGWGPAGSVAFELASGAPAATPASDLDLLVRLPRPLPPGTARALDAGLAEIAGRIGTRIDAQLETPHGAIALKEYAGAQPRVLLRTSAGPCMVADPWAPVMPAPEP